VPIAIVFTVIRVCLKKMLNAMRSEIHSLALNVSRIPNRLSKLASLEMQVKDKRKV
jgi:hypothetical protein